MRRPYPFLTALLALLAPVLALAQTDPAQPETDLYFLGYETEPGMDFGGRTLVSLQGGISRAIGSIRDLGERHPAVAPAWEFPVYGGSGWNATAQVDALLGARWGISAKLGGKSEGFLPGLPAEDGLYLGLGLLAGW